MVFHIYVGSYTNEISTLVFDPETPSLALVSSLTVGFHPSWLAPHPTDPSIVFAGLEQTDGQIVAVKFDKHGHGAVLGHVPSGGGSPCTLLATDSELLIGNVCRSVCSLFIYLTQSRYLSVRIWYLRRNPVADRSASSGRLAADFAVLFWNGPQQRTAGGVAPAPGHHPPRSQGATHP
jgi:hypothetical protein